MTALSPSGGRGRWPDGQAPRHLLGSRQRPSSQSVHSDPSALPPTQAGTRLVLAPVPCCWPTRALRRTGGKIVDEAVVGDVAIEPKQIATHVGVDDGRCIFVPAPQIDLILVEPISNTLLPTTSLAVLIGFEDVGVVARIPSRPTLAVFADKIRALSKPPVVSGLVLHRTLEAGIKISALVFEFQIPGHVIDASAGILHRPGLQLQPIIGPVAGGSQRTTPM